MRLLLTLLLAVVIVVSGCLDEGDDGDDGTSTSTDDGLGQNNTTLEPEVFSDTGMVLASAGGGGFSDGALVFTVDANATLLYAELVWDDPVVDLDVSLASPSSGSTDQTTSWDHQGEGGAPGSPDSPHALTVEAPESGEWRGGASANGAGANTEYTIAVSVFYGETAVPDGYTALP